MDRGVFQAPKNLDCNLLAGNLWIQLFKLHELANIVRQNKDLEFTEKLNRIREIGRTDDNVEKSEVLAETETLSWPPEFVNVYLTNHMSNIERERCIHFLGKLIVSIYPKDSAHNIHT